MQHPCDGAIGWVIVAEERWVRVGYLTTSNCCNQCGSDGKNSLIKTQTS
jgi:hypothetical protein